MWGKSPRCVRFAAAVVLYLQSLLSGNGGKWVWNFLRLSLEHPGTNPLRIQSWIHFLSAKQIKQAKHRNTIEFWHMFPLLFCNHTSSGDHFELPHAISSPRHVCGSIQGVRGEHPLSTAWRSCDSMDWFKGTSWPETIDFPLNQSIELMAKKGKVISR